MEKRVVIEHKVLEEKENGIFVVKGYDVMKTIASRRSMPLIPRVTEELKKEKALQEEHKGLVCRQCDIPDAGCSGG